MGDSKAGRILIVDDEDLFREDLATLLREEGFDCRTAPDGLAGVAIAQEWGPDIVLCDIVMPGRGGVETLEEMKRLSPETGVIMITAHGTLQTAVEAFRKGAADYILKPFVWEDVLQKLRRFLDHRALAIEVAHLRREISNREVPRALVGESDAMRELLGWVQKIAPTDSTVLVTGESGSGKEVVSRALHDLSPRKDRRFVAVNCAAVAESLLDSELFGHKRGAFTGAVRDQAGLFEAASGGTLFLDEISETSPGFQAKLLRAVEAKEILPVGEVRPRRVDARIITSTNRDLAEWVRQGRFREDLHHRLRGIEIRVPPLRERKGDIPLLAEHFIRIFNRKLKRNVAGADRDATRCLMAYAWPGNVRELENVIERAIILGTAPRIGVRDLPPDITGLAVSRAGSDLAEAMKAYEREQIHQVLAECDGNREETARQLGINVATLYRKLAEEKS